MMLSETLIFFLCACLVNLMIDILAQLMLICCCYFVLAHSQPIPVMGFVWRVLPAGFGEFFLAL